MEFTGACFIDSIHKSAPTKKLDIIVMCSTGDAGLGQARAKHGMMVI